MALAPPGVTPNTKKGAEAIKSRWQPCDVIQTFIWTTAILRDHGDHLPAYRSRKRGQPPGRGLQTTQDGVTYARRKSTRQRRVRCRHDLGRGFDRIADDRPGRAVFESCHRACGRDPTRQPNNGRSTSRTQSSITSGPLSAPNALHAPEAQRRPVLVDGDRAHRVEAQAFQDVPTGVAVECAPVSFG